MGRTVFTRISGKTNWSYCYVYKFRASIQDINILSKTKTCITAWWIYLKLKSALQHDVVQPEISLRFLYDCLYCKNFKQTLTTFTTNPWQSRKSELVVGLRTLVWINRLYCSKADQTISLLYYPHLTFCFSKVWRRNLLQFASYKLAQNKLHFFIEYSKKTLFIFS